MDTRRASPSCFAAILALAGCAVAEAQPAPPSQCPPLIAQVRAAIGSGGACETVADCAMYPAGLRGVTNCGGLTDRATAARVRELTDRMLLVCRRNELRQMECGVPSCMAGCEAHRCVCHGAPASNAPPTTTARGRRAAPSRTR